MARDSRALPLRLLHRLLVEGTATGLSDAQLVERFVATRDPEAFAALVARHGPMVMAVCRGLLGPDGDADDAFQATFLILLNRVGTFPVGQSLGGWLYRVARRVARQARLSHARRRRREMAAGPRAALAADGDPERSEILRVIRQEVELLPERYRAPIVLCDLQGLTRDEAADLLGCPAGTVGSRLARARQRLRDRLRRRGVSPSVLFPPPPEFTPPADAWRTSLEAASRTASSLAAGNPATPAALHLAARAGRAGLGVTVKSAVVAALAAVVTVGLVAAQRGAEPPNVLATPPPTAANPPLKPTTVPDADDPKLAGRFVGRVIDPDGKPLSRARVFIAPDRRELKEMGPVRAQTDADGRFKFDAPDMNYTELDGLPARRQGLLIATFEGYAPDWVVTWGQNRGSFRSHWDPVKGADLTLQLASDDVPIHGRLLDHEGRPLAGARVRLSGLHVPWKRDLDAHLDKYKRSRDQLWVFDYDRSLSRANLLPGVTTETFTDVKGQFRMSGLGRERLADLIVTAPSVVQTQLTVMTRDAPDVVLDRWRSTLGANFTLRLRAGRTVSGVVRDRDTLEPIPGMWVGPHALFRLSQGNGIPPSVTDANGRFTISGIDPVIVPLELQAVPQPGRPYLMAQGVVDGPSDLVIECTRGIPFRLKVVDEAGAAVDAEVEYQAVMPNPYLDGLLRGFSYDVGYPINRAARRAEGIYEGFVLPGPGAVLVKTPGLPDYRPAHVDPKAFFAPGKIDWTAQELLSAYGTRDILHIVRSGTYQHDYAAIVLVNPPVASKPLELSATVVRDKPRRVTILDPEGHPVVGVQTQGLISGTSYGEPRLRASTVAITKLHPDRARRITFVKEDRKLIGFLLARGDGETPYTVRLRPWAAVTGRIVDEDGKALSATATPGKQETEASLSMGTRLRIAGHDDLDVGEFPEIRSKSGGRFRVERLVPGQRYGADVYRGMGWYAGIAFENLVLQPGEVRDLGDIRTRKPVNVRGK